MKKQDYFSQNVAIVAIIYIYIYLCVNLLNSDTYVFICEDEICIKQIM